MLATLSEIITTLFLAAAGVFDAIVSSITG